MSAPIRVLLVDDHAVMRAGFRMILESAGDVAVVGEASNGVEAVVAASTLRPDVICMDVQMPDMDGLEATRRIVADAGVDAAVVVVTTFDRDDYLFDALAAGASGFLLKNAGPEELISAVRVAAAGDALLAPEVTRRVIARFAAVPAHRQAEGPRAPAQGPGASGQVPGAPAQAPGAPGQGPGASAHVSHGQAQGPGAPAPRPVAEPVEARAALELTDREAEVLRLVSQAMSNAEIAQRLYIGEATVKTHVSNVLQKLGARDRVAAVVYAHRHGLA
ncbi:response regulator [Microbacterium kyungheense]|uniref:DNA-binding NarL/FixJ family response regulator n=1 Tax=Microbacterium kyungheense TaxID=1263636 RepID=A0A543EQI5_9MICO|nr:response regulator transcription factor [Microbacterium kyungheense]TQM18524.1 DNA-binding NarL/FixJ family response regulator [Microbacterium kyungheense]TQM23847.1 LuxR family two component transcriptional regulator [Microbacterium kyungheense]